MILNTFFVLVHWCIGALVHFGLDLIGLLFRILCNYCINIYVMGMEHIINKQKIIICSIPINFIFKNF